MILVILDAIALIIYVIVMSSFVSIVWGRFTVIEGSMLPIQQYFWNTERHHNAQFHNEYIDMIYSVYKARGSYLPTRINFNPSLDK